jgi:hypothetical protein
MRDTIARTIGGSTFCVAALLVSACGGGEANNAAGSELGNVGAANTADPSAIEMNNGSGESLPANLATGPDTGSGGAPQPGSAANGTDESDSSADGGSDRGGSDVGGDTGGNAGEDVDGM